MTNSNTQRVKLTIEYDVELFDGDPEDMYEICEYEIDHIKNWGLDSTIPDLDQVKLTIVPVLEVGS